MHNSTRCTMNARGCYFMPLDNARPQSYKQKRHNSTPCTQCSGHNGLHQSIDRAEIKQGHALNNQHTQGAYAQNTT